MPKDNVVFKTLRRLAPHMSKRSTSEGLPIADKNDPSPSLQNQRLAAYLWGSGEITFSARAALAGDFFVKNGAEVQKGFSSLETQEELIRLIALIHESRHMQQDYLTGVGLWDYVFRTQSVMNILSLQKQLSVTAQISEPIEPQYRSLANGKLIGMLHGDEAEEIKIISRMQSSAEDLPLEIAEMFTVKRLLELDAVLYTYMTITSLKFSKRGRRNLRKIDATFSFMTMPKAYSETAIASVTDIMKLITEDKPLEVRMTNAIRWIQFVLTISLAYPDPGYFHGKNIDKDMYLPGVKFIRLLQASVKYMQSTDGSATSLAEIEQHIIQSSEIKYQHYVEFADGWMSYLHKDMDQPFPSLSIARSNILEKKFGDASRSREQIETLYNQAITGDDLFSFSYYDIPLMMRRIDEQSHPILLTNRSFTTPEFDFDRLRHVLSWRLCQFIIGKRLSIVCPLYRSPYCSAKTERCARPFTNLGDTPDDAACRIRQTCFDADPTKLVF